MTASGRNLQGDRFPGRCLESALRAPNKTWNGGRGGLFWTAWPNPLYPTNCGRQLKKINYANRKACRDCPLRARCTDNQFRTVSRLENEAVLDRMQERLAKRPEVLNQRRETVEHPFGSIKQWMHQGAFLMRGLEKVRGEFSLTALAYNLRRVLNLVGFADLMAAVRT